MSLKDQNKPIKVVAFILLTIFYSGVVGTPIIDVSAAFNGSDLKGLVSSSSLIFLSLSFASLALDGLFPKRVKESIVHRRIKHPLPGSRAFSYFAERDSRIDFNKLDATYGPFPVDPAEQNRIFYSIYKTCTDSVAVKDAHKSYLLFRDLAFDTYILSVLAAAYTAIFGAGIAKAGLVFICGAATALVLSFIATNFASRFVCSALANAK